MQRQWDLLNKTELVIEPICLRKANLNSIAAAVAIVLGMERSHVLVVDYREGTLTLDIIKKHVDAHDIVGRKAELLHRLAGLPGVEIPETAAVRSHGMLGWIALDGHEVRQCLERSEAAAKEIVQRISRRVIVFSTGTEVAHGLIEDTNRPVIEQRLAEKGYEVTQGKTLEDDETFIAARLRQAIEGHGYGLVITTGGVGAEDKDHTVEAILRLDPDAATPYLCRFEKGTGRHIKDGVRIAVGCVHDTLIVALPGPNDEVRVGMDALVSGMAVGLDKHDLAGEIAGRLRAILQEKMKHRHPHD